MSRIVSYHVCVFSVTTTTATHNNCEKNLWSIKWDWFNYHLTLQKEGAQEVIDHTESQVGTYWDLNKKEDIQSKCQHKCHLATHRGAQKLIETNVPELFFWDTLLRYQNVLADLISLHGSTLADSPMSRCHEGVEAMSMGKLSPPLRLSPCQPPNGPLPAKPSPPLEWPVE